MISIIYLYNSQRFRIGFRLRLVLKSLQEVKRVNSIRHAFNVKYPEHIRELRQDNDLTQKKLQRF